MSSSTQQPALKLLQWCPVAVEEDEPKVQAEGTASPQCLLVQLQTTRLLLRHRRHRRRLTLSVPMIRARLIEPQAVNVLISELREQCR